MNSEVPIKLKVNLPQRSYDILIERGGLSKAGKWLSSIWDPKKVVIITDNHVRDLYSKELKIILEGSGFEVAVCTFLEGENQKNLTTVNNLYEFLSRHKMTRNDGVVGIGGGVVNDLAGFVASTYMRGISFVQIPTSLTAQVDSSIGGKTSVNTSFAKNMVGTFAQPDGVLIDPDVLKTLAKRELISGLGEVIKYAVIGSVDLWNELDEISGCDEILEHAENIIYNSCNVKRKVIVKDEFDTSDRIYLNFGHTIGHAIELSSGYGKLMHGEAVAIGMVQISRVAERKGLIQKGLTNKIASMCQKFGLPTNSNIWDVDRLYTAIEHDKKVQGQTINIVLVPEISSAIVHHMPLEEIKEYLEK